MVDNAIKFSPPGTTVRIDTWRRDEELGFTVTDSGPGISTSDKQHLFDRFFQADNSPTPDFRGSGLGLAICREVALAHGGRIWVDSAAGEGSAFSLALPSWRALKSQSPAVGTQHDVT